MKIEIFNEKKAKEPEQKVILRLIKEGNRVSLIVVDENGRKRTSGYILSIGEDGVHRNVAVNKDFGFPRDASGCVRDIT